MTVDTISLSQAQTYELPPRTKASGDSSGDGVTLDALPESVLRANVLWFCQLRWVAVTILTLFGLLCLAPSVCRCFGLRSNVVWPFVAAGLLVLTNIGFLNHAQRAGRSQAPSGGGASIWAQIIFDLLILTAVVHCVGARDSCVYLAYLFHIVLACIFFSRGAGFLVTILACLFFTACVAAESIGMLAPSSIYVAPLASVSTVASDTLFIRNMISVQAIWIIVWYLTSHLSAMVRGRDRELALTNRRLVEAQNERARHMLLTTHELKAPFAAIHSNAQLLLKGYCGVLPDKALEVVARIAARSRRLGCEIQDMLQLANLNSPGQADPVPLDLDLVTALRWCMDHVQARAEEHGIAMILEEPAEHPVVCCSEDHLKMLLVNLILNAVTYSYDGGKVHIGCVRLPDGRSALSVTDHGIGIPAAKLEHIFDEYYRTDEAVKHCRESTGLGLAIVRQAAQSWGIEVKVTSQLGQGTRFDLLFPPPGTRPSPRFM